MIGEPSVMNYFVEVHPGREFEEIIRRKKSELIELLGDEVVNDPSRSMFLRDSPHFTLMCARTGDMKRFRKALREMAGELRKIGYEIVDVEDNPTPGNLVEVRTVVKEDDRRKFYLLHEAVMEASLPFNTAGVYERFESGFSGEAQKNIDYCGFPGARSLYRPHASLGRVHESLRPMIEPLVGGGTFDPKGDYTTGDLIVWGLPFDEDDPTATPKHLETIKLRG